MTIVYLTINLINFKFYVGVHDCDPTVYDYYLGGGCYANRPATYLKKKVPFAAALRKHGVKNFRRITLAEFEDRKDALALEALIVNEEFVKNPRTYNVTLGGGDPPSNEVTFYQYDLNGNYIKEWINMTQANIALNISHDRILNAIKQKKSCANYFWSYYKVDKLNLKEYTYTNRGFINVYSKEGDLLYTFSSVREAAKELGLEEANVSNSLFRKGCSLGYYFLRAHENIEDVMSGKGSEILLYYCYDSKGNLFKEFVDIADGLRFIDSENPTRSGLKRAIFKNKEYKGYYWSLEKYPNFFKKENPKKINQFDLDGNLVKTWNSISECKKEFSNCYRVLSGQYTQTKGYIFKYAD